jgi:hypothetical protein
MSTLPSWARKPKHSKEVIATARGWQVKETGEYLKLVRDLDQKLRALSVEVKEAVQVIQEPVAPEPETLTQEQPKEEPAPRKRRGRKPKNETQESVEE